MNCSILLIFGLLTLITFARSDYIQSSDGDLVKCIDKKQQPAFDNHLLKNHKIQEWPTEIPKNIEIKKKNKWQTTEAHISTAKCPEGTIPVRYDREISDNGDNNKHKHEYAMIFSDHPPKMYGTKVIVNVWDPKVEDKETELSISQIWISSGSYEKNDLNTIEVGWQVFPHLYKDNKPRLFTFWTSDAYQTTGCYNLQCPGFIQTSSSIVIGGVITPNSIFGGRQYEITILVWKDQKHGNWWLSLGPDNSLVGYWPGELFTGLDHAQNVEWGGEVVNSHSLGRHTTTQMGSGHFSEEGFGKASYFRNIDIVDNNNSFQPIQKLNTISETKYYDVTNLNANEWGTSFFYGGPGFRPTHSGAVLLTLNLFFIYFSFSFFITI